jgi:dipeptidyl aminopeptidase/acylaminoacyl peptidase
MLRLLTFIFVFVACVSTARATLREIQPGEQVEPTADEGLLVVSVDTDFALGGVRIQRVGSLAATLVRDVKTGVDARLYLATAGDYYFDHASVSATGHYQYDLGEKRYRFSVKPATVNYPGDLLLRNSGGWHARIALANRGLRAMDWLDSTFPAVAALPFAFAGAYPDPFPAFYQAARRTHPGKPAPATAPGAGKPPVDIEDLWREDRVRLVRLSPDGALVAVVLQDKDAWSVDLVDVRRGTSRQLAKVAAPIAQAIWKSERTLVLGIGAYSDRLLIEVLALADLDAPQPRVTTMAFGRTGAIVDVLPHDPAHLLFSTRSSNGRLVVQKVDLSSQKTIDATDFSEAKRLNRGVADDRAWFTDGRGELRAAIASKDGVATLFHGSGGMFVPVKLPGEPGDFIPYGLSADGSLLYGVTDEGRAQGELVAFDPKAGRIVSTVFSKPGVDIELPLFDDSHEPVGVAYYVEGRFSTEYFDPVRKRLDARIAQAFPGESALVVDHDAALSHAILVVESPTRPPAYFHLDLQSRQASLLYEGRPWLAGHAWSRTHVVHTQGTDDLPIEAYLTLPETPAGKRRPLVVMIHGGPVGVRDSVGFDPDVQLVASLGYAVLQVNFRGSEGFGRAFREAGNGRVGTMIEDDIDVALDAALERYPLDRERVCAFGASYGGYSSMISAVRRPTRFRCVVSMMGVSDAPLMFTASDATWSEYTRRYWQDVLGDPRTDMDALQEHSPLYRYEQLRAPLLLIHGHEDRRVDFEHTRRLARMLGLAGRPPQLVEIMDAGHGITTAAQRALVYPALVKFLHDHLGEP